MSEKDVQHDEITMRDITDFVLRTKWWLMLSAACAMTGAWYQQSKSQRFLTSALIQVQKSQNNPMQALSQKMSGLSGGGSSENEFLENVQQYFKSDVFARALADDLVNRPEFAKIERNLQSSEDAIGDFFRQTLSTLGLDSRANRAGAGERAQVLADHLQRLIGADIVGADTVRVWMKADNVNLAVQVLNIGVDLGVDAIIKRNLNELSRTEQFVRNKIVNIEKDINATQDEVVRLRTLIGISADGSNSAAPAISKLQDNINTAESERVRREELLNSLHDRLSGPQDFNSISKLEKLRDERDYWTATVNSLRGSLKRMTSKQKNMPDVAQKLTNLSRQLEFQFKIYADMKSQSMQIEMMQISIANKIQVYDRASPSTTFGRSSRGKNLAVAGFIAVLLTGLLAFLYESVYPPLRGRKDLVGMPLTYVGSIPDFRQRRYRLATERLVSTPGFKNNHLIWQNILYHGFVDSPETMIFKSLRAKILHFSEKEKVKVICVTSPRPGDGKSMISSNLASTLAMAKKKVLLVDCDLCKPKSSAVHGNPAGTGLSEFLRTEAPPEESEKLVQKLIDNLDVLPAGPFIVDGVDPFSNEKLKQVVDFMRNKYDFIILDCPPALAVPESMAVVKFADATLLSFTQLETKLEEARFLVEELKFNEIEKLIYVLNWSKLQTGFDSAYAYGYQYARNTTDNAA